MWNIYIYIYIYSVKSQQSSCCWTDLAIENNFGTKREDFD